MVTDPTGEGGQRMGRNGPPSYFSGEAPGGVTSGGGAGFEVLGIVTETLQKWDPKYYSLPLRPQSDDPTFIDPCRDHQCFKADPSPYPYIWHPEPQFGAFDVLADGLERFKQRYWFLFPSSGPVPNLPPVSPQNVQLISAYDPNELVGPSGFAIQHFVIPGNIFSYDIIFENETNATAPAQSVRITNPLSSNLDWSTFELVDVAFGDHFIAVPPHSQHFQTSIPVSLNGANFQVQLEAGIDLDGGRVFADFVSIDPLTSLPPNVQIGFLPPEDGTGRGIGHVSYLIRPKQNLATGTEVRNVALIRFDMNPVISTDQVDPHDPSKGVDSNKQALVTIDTTAPHSAVSVLTSITRSASFPVCWSGSDIGSGIVTYDVYVQTNSGPWAVCLAGTTNTCWRFEGSNGTSYGFYSVAHDGVENIEPPKSLAEASTLVSTNASPPVFESVSAIGGNLRLTWTVIQGRSYQLQFTTDLNQENWSNSGNTITATNSSVVTSDVTGPDRQQFYRVIMLP